MMGKRRLPRPIATVVPFPSARRVDLVERTAHEALSVSAPAAERAIAIALLSEKNRLQRLPIDPEAIAVQVQNPGGGDPSRHALRPPAPRRSLMFARYAPCLIANGYRPVPIQPGSKACTVTGWTNRTSARDLGRWLKRYPTWGVGLATGDIIGLDIDVLEDEAALRLQDLAYGLLGSTPFVRIGMAPKRLLGYRLREPMPSMRRTLSCGRLEVLAQGSQFVSHAIHPDTGEPYQWIGESSPLETPLTDLPTVTPLQEKTIWSRHLGSFRHPPKIALRR